MAAAGAVGTLAAIIMKNPSIIISEQWTIKRDEFYEIDPLDRSVDDDKKYRYLFCQQDLLWIKKSDFNLDVGWYGEDESGHFGLHLYKGRNWHYCQLLEKRYTKDYRSIIELINYVIQNVEAGRYEFIETQWCSIDKYLDSKIVSVLNE